MKEKIIYLDNSATTKVDEKVLKEMIPYFNKNYGNASSSHSFGLIAKEAVENARRIIAKSINANLNEIYFTSGGTESNNWVLKSLFEAWKESGKNHIITTKIEHDSILNVCKELEKEGAKITYLDPDSEGFIKWQDVENAITEKTFLISMIHANNEIGTIQNLKEIGNIAKKHGVHFHSDACQSYTKTKIDVKEQHLDLLTLNAHKLHGPKGIGVLYIKNGIKVSPILHGGGHENMMRSGTENVPGIVGFGKAVEISNQKDVKNIENLRNYIIKEILTIKKSKLNGSIKNRLCNNINISFSDIEGEAIASYLEQDNIFISTGSACASHSLKKSHVLKAIGRNDFEINSSIRISISKYTTKKDASFFLKKLRQVVEKLRKISPFA